MRGARALVGLAGALAFLLGTAGCGESEYTYVSSGSFDTIFRVPAEWHRFAEEDLEESIFGTESESSQVAAERSWVAGFDASGEPDVDHLFGTDAEEPNLYAMVRELDQTTQGALSLDSMRNVLLPVTAEARQQATQEGSAPQGFELLVDETIEDDNGMRGVHVVYNYDLGESLQTFDQTVLVDQATSRMHLLLVRCSATCYRDRSDELQDVATSFTVKD